MIPKRNKKDLSLKGAIEQIDKWMTGLDVGEPETDPLAIKRKPAKSIRKKADNKKVDNKGTEGNLVLNNQTDDLVEMDVNLGFCLPGGRLPKVRTANFAVAPRATRKMVNNEYCYDLAFKLYGAVVEILKWKESRLEQDSFSDDEKKAIIKAAKDLDMNIVDNDFDKIIDIVKTINDEPVKFRHASLNSQDYDILKDEFDKLKEQINERALAKLCPKLCQIVREAIQGEGKPYPGRHLPYADLTGKMAWRYQRLHILDEILCSADRRLTNQEIIEKIETKVKDKINVEGQKITPNSLSKDFLWLGCLAESDKSKRGRHVYDKEDSNISIYFPSESIAKGKFYNAKRKYTPLDNGKRRCAFCVDISLTEAALLRQQIGRLREKHFRGNSETFAKKYPLIFQLGYINDIIDGIKDNREIENIDGTDLYLIDYVNNPELDKSEQAKLLELKRKINIIINDPFPLPVKREDGWDYVIPKSIRYKETTAKNGKKLEEEYENSWQWSLLARSITSPYPLLMIPAAELIPTFDIPNLPVDMEEDSGQYCIGTSRLLSDKPVDITLNIKYKSPFKMLNLPGNDSVLHQLKPEKSHQDGERVWQMSFRAYLNDDLFEEIYKLDKEKMLETIEPEDVYNRYCSFYESKTRKKRKPLSERKAASRSTNQKIDE